MPRHPANRLERRRISKRKDASRGISRLAAAGRKLPVNMRNREKSRFPLRRLRGLPATKTLTPEGAERAKHHISFRSHKGLEHPLPQEIKRREYGVNWNRLKKTPFER